jgi:hypothetical protein
MEAYIYPCKAACFSWDVSTLPASDGRCKEVSTALCPCHSRPQNTPLCRRVCQIDNQLPEGCLDDYPSASNAAHNVPFCGEPRTTRHDNGLGGCGLHVPFHRPLDARANIREVLPNCKHSKHSKRSERQIPLLAGSRMLPSALQPVRGVVPLAQSGRDVLRRQKSWE